MTYAIYIITNTVNAKQYVGITNNLKRRWSDHKRANGNQQIHFAIKKYGVEAFVFTHIANAFNLDSAQAIERMMILEHNTKYPCGYNHTDGGDGVVSPSELTKKKIADKRRGSKHTPEARAKMSLAKMGKLSPMKGKTFPAEVRAKMSEAKKGKPAHNKGKKSNPESVAKMIAAKKGKPWTESQRAAIMAGRALAKIQKESKVAA